MAVIKIIGLAVGMSCPFDGQYLVEFDPDRRGVDPDGGELTAHIVCSPDPADAKQYESKLAAMSEWKRISSRWPLREYDGRPNRPLTAFTVEIA